MTDRNSGQLEVQAEQIRDGIAETVEALQDRLSPGNMIDKFMAYIKDSDGTLALDNLRRQARENPVALAMIGSGIAWLALGGGGDRARATEGARSGVRRGWSAPSDYASHAGMEADGDDGGLRRAGSADGDAKSGFADKASEFAEQAKDAAGHAADRGHAAVDEVRDIAQRGRQSVMDALDREPLVLGAIGVAIGAALGAMLPSTRLEDETFGKTRDALLHNAEKAVDHVAEAARKVGEEAFEAGKSTYREGGLTKEGQAVADRVGDAAKSALSAGKGAAEREFGSTAPAEPRPVGRPAQATERLFETTVSRGDR